MIEDEQIVIPFGAAPNCETIGLVHDGTLVSISGERLVMKSVDGHLYSFQVTTATDVFTDGITCRPENLAAGCKIRLTTNADNKNLVHTIESLVTLAAFAAITDAHDA